jgi:hypothetical protein
MEPKGSIPCSQEPSTGPYPKPRQSNQHHPILSLLRSILILSTHLHLGLPSGLFLSGFSTNILYVFLFSTIRATYPVHLLLDLIILIILGKEYKLWSSSLRVCSFLQPLVTSSSVQIFSSTPSSQTLAVYVPHLMSETKFHTHTERLYISVTGNLNLSFTLPSMFLDQAAVSTGFGRETWRS